MQSWYLLHLPLQALWMEKGPCSHVIQNNTSDVVLGHGGQRLDSLQPFCHSEAGGCQFVSTHLLVFFGAGQPAHSFSCPRTIVGPYRCQRDRMSSIFQTEVHGYTGKLNPQIQVMALGLVCPGFSCVAAPSTSPCECLRPMALVCSEERFTEDAGSTWGAWGYQTSGQML